jgi:hypothetical protein
MGTEGVLPFAVVVFPFWLKRGVGLCPTGYLKCRFPLCRCRSRGLGRHLRAWTSSTMTIQKLFVILRARAESLYAFYLLVVVVSLPYIRKETATTTTKRKTTSL